MERYKNKWFRLSLEKDLKTENLGVNVHCKKDGMHITIPPPSLYDTAEELEEIESFNPENGNIYKVVNRVKEFTKDYGVTVELETAIYGDNVKLKLKVENAG